MIDLPQLSPIFSPDGIEVLDLTEDDLQLKTLEEVEIPPSFIVIDEVGPSESPIKTSSPRPGIASTSTTDTSLGYNINEPKFFPYYINGPLHNTKTKFLNRNAIKYKYIHNFGQLVARKIRDPKLRFKRHIYEPLNYAPPSKNSK